MKINILLFAALLLASPAIAETPTNELTAKKENIQVVATLRVPQKDGCQEFGWSWGNELGCPKKVIARLQVSDGGKDIFIPLSSYGDLASPTKLEITKENEGFLIQIVGGDAATSYRAVLTFSKGALRKRRVVSGEFSEEVWEETSYSDPNKIVVD